MNILKQKLSHSNIPFVLCVPNRPPQPKNAPQLRRMRFWNTQLGSFGKIVGVNMTSLINSETTHQEYIDQMVKSTRANVLDLHKRHPNKPIVLVGWDNAALISLYVALLEPQNVTAVCCLGLPLKSLKGWRGEDIDPLTSLKCPVFIAAGSESLNSDPDEIDELRDQFEVQSALVVVQGGDSLLRVPTNIQHEHGITQAMADKMVIDEMWEFLNSQITQKYAKIENTNVPVLGAPSTPKSTIIIDPIKPQSSKKPVGRPPKSKAEENTVKEYTLFLKKKIKILGRMPSTDENKKFFAEFNRLKNKDKKRKTEETDKEWTLPSEKKAKNDKNRKISSQGLIAVPVTMNQRSQKESENIESQNAALNLERLLESN